MSTVLERICNRRRQDVAAAQAVLPLAKLREQSQAQARRALSLIAAIHAKQQAGQRAIIAEIKRASPSAGVIQGGVDAPKQAQGYVQGGAAAMSILTEPHEFLGRDDDLRQVRQFCPETPLLRKDFNVDPYQIWEAKAMGADVVLLLVNVLGDELQKFLDVAAEAELEALVETHDAAELKLALATDAKLIGINARNLKTFETRLEWVEELLAQMPGDRLAIAESGVKTLADIERLEKRGAAAYLIGETLMRASDPQALLRQWRAS